MTCAESLCRQPLTPASVRLVPHPRASRAEPGSLTLVWLGALACADCVASDVLRFPRLHLSKSDRNPRRARGPRGSRSKESCAVRGARWGRSYDRLKSKHRPPRHVPPLLETCDAPRRRRQRTREPPRTSRLSRSPARPLAQDGSGSSRRSTLPGRPSRPLCPASLCPFRREDPPRDGLRDARGPRLSFQQKRRGARAGRTGLESAARSR